MTSKHVARIKQIDEQVRAIEKIIKRGEFNAAGIAMTLHVGPVPEDRSPELNLELTWELEPLLANILASLAQSRKMSVSWARGELKELQTFFESEPD